MNNCVLCLNNINNNIPLLLYSYIKTCNCNYNIHNSCFIKMIKYNFDNKLNINCCLCNKELLNIKEIKLNIKKIKLNINDNNIKIILIVKILRFIGLLFFSYIFLFNYMKLCLLIINNINNIINKY